MRAKIRLSSDRGLTDLKSVIVAIAISLILAGAVLMVTKVVQPWQQSINAQSSLTTIHAAQASVYSSTKKYVDYQGLKDRGLIPRNMTASEQPIIVALDSPYLPESGVPSGQPSGKHYVAILKVDEDKTFYMSDTIKEPQQLNTH